MPAAAVWLAFAARSEMRRIACWKRSASGRRTSSGTGPIRDQLACACRTSSVAGPGGQRDDPSVSPTTKLAAMLKEALAANTIGGKVDTDSRMRAANEEVRQAQASWSRIGPVPDEVRRALGDRFQRAIRQIAERAGETGRPGLVGAGRR